MNEWIAVGLSLAAGWFGPFIEPPKVQLKQLGPATLGRADLDRHRILLDKDRDWTRRMTICVVAHEYGHLTLIWHSSNPLSIMYPRHNPPACKRWIRLARRHLKDQ